MEYVMPLIQAEGNRATIITRLFKEAMQECISCKIALGKIIKISLNHSYRAWGVCRKLPDNTFQIELNDMLFENYASDASIKDTLLHEMCHTLPNSDGHDTEWQKAVNKLNTMFGYNIQSANDAESKGMPPLERLIETDVKTNPSNQFEIDLMNMGYELHTPSIFDEPSVELSLSKCFDDEKGVKYFIIIKRVRRMFAIYEESLQNSDYEYQTCLREKENNNTVSLTFIQPWTIEKIEKHVEKLFNTGVYDYYIAYKNRNEEEE